MNEVAPGTLIGGRWRVTGVVAEGSTGSVLRAEPVTGGSPVAIKVLRVERAGPLDQDRRFEREALAAAKMQHPNVVSIHDFGALDDGRPYLVMDLVEGKSLAALLAEEPMLPVRRALGITAHLLRGLAHVHDSGVVHRDLKPADIALVDRDGDRDTAVLLDFGAAKLVGGSGAANQPLTRAGIALGDLAYMAPERLSDGEVDARADLYSTTCVLWHMVTGRPPFGASGEVDPQELVRRQLTMATPRLADSAPEVESSPALDAVLARGLARNPAERFRSAEEYLTAVEALIEGRLDPAMVGKASPAQRRRLAEPDPNQATTVFHGAPRPGGPAATELQPPPTAPPLPWSRPVLDRAAPAVVAQDSPRDEQRRFSKTAAGGGAALLLLVVALVARSACSDDRQGAGPLGGLEEAWRREGLEPSGFAAVPGASLGGGDCRSGVVSALDVTVCRYPSAQAAGQARARGLAAVGESGGAAVVSGPRLLVVTDPEGIDPSRKSIDRLIRTLQDIDRRD